MELVFAVRDIGDSLRIPYMIENPRSRISSEWREADFGFHPHEYGGYLPEDDRHPIAPNFIPPRDAYCKFTCLWTGHGFVLPRKKSVTPTRERNDGRNRLGGKSKLTKFIRSLTPRGFARAVYEANSRRIAGESY